MSLTGIRNAPRIITFFLVLLGALGAGWIYYIRQPVSLCRNLSCIRFPGSDTYRLSETYSDTPDSYRALYTSGTHMIRVSAEKVRPENADDAIQASITRMNALFEKAPAPYPGDISDAVVCDPAFIPSFHTVSGTSGTIRYFTGYLNNRMTFGSCSQNQAVYRGSTAFFSCAEQELIIQAEYMIPVSEGSTETELQRVAEHLSCSH